MIVRFERWGAWVKLEREPALVALDRDGVRALGLDGGAAWQEVSPSPSRPLEVHVAVTSRCAAGCEGCYLDARPDGIEPARDVIERRFDALAGAGVFTVAFGGGEPTLRDDLGELADAARARGLTPVVTTSGLGLGERKLGHLRRFAQVNVSYDGNAEGYATVRGFDGAASAESAIARLVAAGATVGVNVVLTRATFDQTLATLRRAFELGAREAQLLRYKPAGRAKNLDYLARRLTPEQAERLGPLLRELASSLPELRVRIDCALVPFLSADADLAARPDELARWGVLGCEAGAALAATRVDGAVLPCSFAGATSITAADIGGRGWADDPVLQAFRAFPEAPPEPCASCTLRPICRGGCKVVADFVDGAIGPDPECPRVRRERQADAQ
ncbi:MAG: Radical domain heme biosynthesis protein [Labilithrix sp.]|nr:Radical domain heme biosynthesis protein [Labilithrix sp.]